MKCHIVTAAAALTGAAMASNAFSHATPIAPFCLQADGPRARAARFPNGVSISGAGSFELGSGRTQYVWTGSDCVAWIIARGPIQADSGERNVLLLTGGEFAAHDERDATTRDYRTAGSGGATFALNGREVSPSADDREWIAAMTREYLRRSGTDARARARGIAQHHGLHALLAEARLIPRAATRSEYLIEGYAIVRDPSARTSFVREAAFLVDGTVARANFLVGTPLSWRGDADVLGAIYEATAGIDEDQAVETLLRAFPPPRPIPEPLRRPLRAVVSSLGTIERRVALEAEYFGARQ
jgi:hypothetical protein